MGKIALTTKVPYYAVVFTSIRASVDNGYNETSDNLVNIVSKFKGYLGAESVRNNEGFGITISYWDSIDSINEWRKNTTHAEAKSMGRKMWYSEYMIRICKVESDNHFKV